MKQLSGHIRYALMAVLAVGIVVVSIFLVQLQNSLDPQGETNDICTSVGLLSVPNGHGLVATAHETACDGFGGSEAV
jgi:hypothetical protein